MIGLVLVAHAGLATELRKVVEHVMGPQEAFEILDIAADDDMDHKRKQLQDKISLVNKGAGVLLLTDMFGGTPSNLAISFLTENHLEVIAGMNVPMLVKLVSIRGEKSLHLAAEEAQVAAKSYINVASQLLNTG
tara:strand:+ start:2195 stop:2596 length:402 start_codon:yes stop_codon:yes gene_type:complete